VIEDYVVCILVFIRFSGTVNFFNIEEESSTLDYAGHM
jgi:hypothetical protein